MAASQDKKAKDKFFQDLYRLDHLDEDSNDFGVSSPQHLPKQSARIPGTKPIVSAHEAVQIERSKRKRSALIENPKPLQQAASSFALLRPSKKSKPSDLRRNMTDPTERRRNITDPTEMRRMTDLSNLKPRKGVPKVPRIPPGKQIFKGCGFVFFFVPNNDLDPSFAFRIYKAVHHGALWANEFSKDVTHVVVAQNLDVKEASKAFPAKEIPNGPILVSEIWLWRCFGLKVLLDTNAGRYLVKGSEGLRPPDKPSSAFVMKPAGVGQHQENDTTRRNTVSEHEEIFLHFKSNAKTKGKHPGDDEASLEDELDIAIRDVERLADLLSDAPFDSDANLEDEADVEPKLTRFGNNYKAPKESAKFVCMEKNDGRDHDEIPNARTIEKLSEMANHHDKAGDSNDTFRTTAYRKAIGTLRKQSQLIRTKPQALALPGIGESIAEKIEEIVSTGSLRRLENAQLDPRENVIKLFKGVYGAGHSTASIWYAQGHRTLGDLYQKAELSANQRVGIEHYDDFQQRISRSEVAEHGAIVEEALQAADPNFQMIIGGSYRRGLPDCGDIDCLITMENATIAHIRTLMTETVIPGLRAQGFLKVALAGGHLGSDNSSKWHGVSALPGSNIWRRIDLLFVSWAEYGAAKLYFTGNDLFNRSIRLLAGRKQMRLNQHGLFADVIRGRGRQRITDGRLLEGQSEERIFELLGVTYRSPEDRNIGVWRTE